LGRKFENDEERNKYEQLIIKAKDEDILVESLKIGQPSPDDKKHKVNEHLYSFHFERKWTCIVCQEILHCTGFGYEEHVKLKHGEEFLKYNCEICTRKGIAKFELYCSHLKTHLNDFNCEKCGRRFGKKVLLSQHLGTCGIEERSFVCPTCGKGFKNEIGVNQHLKRTHMHGGGSDAIKCEHCGKTYKSKQGYEMHYKAEHEGFRISCDICGNEFKSKVHLKYHKRTVHTDEKAFPCTFCSYTTSFSQSLHSHMQRVHNQSKLHPCTECDKSFFTMGELKSHVRIHTNVTGFHCDQCGKGFKGKQALKEHGYSHTGEYPHKCEFCERQFRSRANYYSHRKNCKAGF